MSATFIIRKDCAWLPGGGRFESTLKLIVEEIAEDAPIVANTFRQVAEWRDDYIDISKVTQAEFRVILEAVKKIQKEILEVSSPERYRDRYGLAWALSELKVGLLLDPRANYTTDKIGTVVVNTTSSWEAVEWLYDFVLEGVIAWLKHHEENFLVTLHNQGLQDRKIDLSTLNIQQFHMLLQQIEYMHEIYGDAGVRGINCREFLHAFAPKINELYEMFKSDPRAEDAQETSLDRSEC